MTQEIIWLIIFLIIVAIALFGAYNLGRVHGSGDAIHAIMDTFVEVFGEMSDTKGDKENEEE